MTPSQEILASNMHSQRYQKAVVTGATRNKEADPRKRRRISVASQDEGLTACQRVRYTQSQIKLSGINSEQEEIGQRVRPLPVVRTGTHLLQRIVEPTSDSENEKMLPTQRVAQSSATIPHA
ncbi:hypothetical protein M378DRAFT_19371 [Amanita muscaria Koide BX008]|uniref:Uncharacterized protein n=1 Tax=Amanita muscaria (strain Koide BX008) TaxID=946122 RepID=A0A0C2WD32_AMAMK|nr:hypothetical protein M378DRAFT_19371 [Amanita muscaria Koide BX008]